MTLAGVGWHAREIIPDVEGRQVPWNRKPLPVATALEAGRQTLIASRTWNRRSDPSYGYNIPRTFPVVRAIARGTVDAVRE